MYALLLSVRRSSPTKSFAGPTSPWACQSLGNQPYKGLRVGLRAYGLEVWNARFPDLIPEFLRAAIKNMLRLEMGTPCWIRNAKTSRSACSALLSVR